jgi:hypothetical protein
MKKLNKLQEIHQTAIVTDKRGNATPIGYDNLNTIKDLKKHSDVAKITKIDGQPLEEEEGATPFEYSKTDSTALGSEVIRVLKTTLKAQGDEIHRRPDGKPDVKLQAGANRFSIEVNYGDNVLAKNDIFKFKIDPQAGKLLFKLGKYDVPLVNIGATDGNNSAMNTVLLQKNLGVVLKKLKKMPKVNDSEPEETPVEAPETEPVVPKEDPLKEEILGEIEFTINGLGKYTSISGDADTITGKDQGGTVRTFSRKKVELDNPGIFDKKPREKRPEGVRPYSESQYRDILQGAIDDAGSTEFAYDMAESMILDPRILAKLKKDYPEESAQGLKERLQWDLESCDSPEDDYDDDDYEVAETTRHVGDEYVNYPEHGGKRLGTFHSKKAAEKQLTAIHIKQHQKENLDPVGHEDADVNNDGEVNNTDKYLKHRRDVISKNMDEDLDLGHEDDEPGMLLGDIYGIMQSAKSLYELVSQFEGQGEVDFPHWWQAKIVNAKANLSAARQYLDYEVNKPQPEPSADVQLASLNEKKATYCGKCGHTHVKGTPCP